MLVKEATDEYIYICIYNLQGTIPSTLFEIPYKNLPA